MAVALQLASQDLANDLRALLEEIDPARWRDEVESAARQRVAAITERLQGMMADGASATAVSADARYAQLVERLGQLRATLDHAMESLPSRDELTAQMHSSRAAWAAFQQDVQPAYEALAASLRGMTLSAPAPLRPTNYTRNVFHVFCGLSVVTLIEALPSRTWLVALPLVVAVWAWSAEISRRIWPSINDRLMGLFGKVAHAHERHRVNSSTWFVTGLVLLGALYPRFSAAVGVAVLGLADPSAALVGRRFGRTKLRAGRSLQGTAAFFVVGFFAALAVLAIRHPAPAWSLMVTAAAASLVGAIAELYTERLDDNFTIPLASASAAWLAGSLVGVV